MLPVVIGLFQTLVKAGTSGLALFRDLPLSLRVLELFLCPACPVSCRLGPEAGQVQSIRVWGEIASCSRCLGSTASVVGVSIGERRRGRRAGWCRLLSDEGELVCAGSIFASVALTYPCSLFPVLSFRPGSWVG